MKRQALRIILGLILTLVVCLESAGFISLPFLRRLEAICYDLRLTLTMPRTVDPRIVIIDIDDKSLAREGRWPWSRDRLALLLDNLFDRYHVAVVGFDVVFAEEDNSSGIKVLEGLAAGDMKRNDPFRRLLPGLKKRLDYDTRFASAIKDRPVVMGYYFTGDDRAGALKSGQLPPPVLPGEAFAQRSIPFVSMKGHGANLAGLQQSAASAGHFNPYIDPDGQCRKVPVLIEYGGNYYEALSVAMVRTLFGNPPLEPVFPTSAEKGYDAVESVRMSDLSIPVDRQVCALVPYRGGQGSFRYVSATDVLRKTVPPDQLEGTIVLVGTTALGLMEQRSTPVSEVFPGVEIHANMIAGLLDQNFRHRPAYAGGGELAVLLIFGLVLSVVLPFRAPLGATLISLGALAVVVGGNAAAWHQHLVLPIASPLLLISALYTFNMTFGFFAETRARHRLAGLFGQYIPPQLVKEMSAAHQEFTMEGESRDMTVLFSDIRNFTTLSEGMDPKQLTRMMNEYLTPTTQVIHRQRGTIDKYIGDAIMAFWGAPLRDEAHAANSVLAALEMKTAMAELREDFRQRGWPELRIGIGISSGVMNVGNMGSHFRRAYTVMGDVVNLGSRLEGLTKHYGVEIIIAEATRNALSGIVCRELDRVRVKGKEEPISIYEPLCREGELDQNSLFELARFQEGLEFYRAQKWSEAEGIFTELLANSPGSELYRLYLERVDHFLSDPPPQEWDGVFRFKSK